MSRTPAMSPSRLRSDLYRVLDSVIDTGDPVEIRRRGRVLRIVVEPLPRKLDRLVARPGVIVGEPSELVDVNWAGHWKP